MTEEDRIILSTIIDKIAPNFIYGYHELEDVKQQCWTWLEAINRHERDKWGNLIKNRLSSWKRDSYER